MAGERPLHAKMIEQARIDAGLSRAQLAAKLGWSEIRLWRIEMGKTKALAEDVASIAAALDKSIAALFGEAA
jgi:transcriptional regulator with XRE-family HTH domain